MGKDGQDHTIKQEIADNDNDVDATLNPNDDNFEATSINKKDNNEDMVKSLSESDQPFSATSSTNSKSTRST